ncbi:hypothetical protein L484_009943 [Morus notabilis]|uniref:Uncharacterized protein n=1 Tax=Morus notabilis TaxID=981085 RepID=W9SCP2_9ROSA|nr:hypothetical protein L484_009943 [Morus notabilis]
MVREYYWRGSSGVGERGSVTESLSGVVLVLLAALVSLALILAVVFSCADGASKDKASATQTDTYGGTACAAGCGAACGG